MYDPPGQPPYYDIDEYLAKQMQAWRMARARAKYVAMKIAQKKTEEEIFDAVCRVDALEWYSRDLQRVEIEIADFERENGVVILWRGE